MRLGPPVFIYTLPTHSYLHPHLQILLSFFDWKYQVLPDINGLLGLMAYSSTTGYQLLPAAL